MNSSEVCARAGITYRQLDNWTRVGYIRSTNNAHGTGHSREWTRREVEITRRIRILTEYGFTLDRASEIAHHEEQDHIEGAATRKGDEILLHCKWALP